MSSLLTRILFTGSRTNGAAGCAVNDQGSRPDAAEAGPPPDLAPARDTVAKPDTTAVSLCTSQPQPIFSSAYQIKIDKADPAKLAVDESFKVSFAKDGVKACDSSPAGTQMDLVFTLLGQEFSAVKDSSPDYYFTLALNTSSCQTIGLKAKDLTRQSEATFPGTLQVCTADSTPTQPSDALITWTPTLINNLDSHDAANWEMSDWSNGGMFNCTWKPDHVLFNNGILSLLLDNAGCPDSCRTLPYASGEYRTTAQSYGFGYYEVRMMPTKGDGLVAGSFFTYTDTPVHDEIDFEFLGKNPQGVQTNYYIEGVGGHEKIISLGFDASASFHNYGLKWTAQDLTWYVDGQPVRTETASSSVKLPYNPGRIFMNLWPGTTAASSWLNNFTYQAPQTAQYDWIKYSSL